MLHRPQGLTLIDKHELRLPYKEELHLQGQRVLDISLAEWASLHNWCFLCGKHGRLQVHHIERRSHCYKPHQDWTENLFKACLECHEGPLATMRHRLQLAYKWLNDPSGWDSLDFFTKSWLQIGDKELRAPRRVTPEEIECEVLSISDTVLRFPGIRRNLARKLLLLNSHEVI